MGNQQINPVIVADQAIRQIPVFLKELPPASRLLIIADDRTFPIAGEQTRAVLSSAGFQVRTCILEREAQLIPDERALGEIVLAMEPDSALLVSVGAGSITDLTRYSSAKFNKPFIAVPTAPSMDGYASPVAPLTIKGFKRTWPARPPLAIFGDLEILTAAPDVMKQAGYGDLLGKYTSLADWKLGTLLNEEAYAPEVAEMVRNAVDRTVESLKRAAPERPRTQLLTEALIISGEAMLQWGDSRPASGSEHHLAHFWEMQAALAGHPEPLHGIKVGVAVLLMLRVYQKLFALTRAEVAQLIGAYRPETATDYAARIKRVYGPLAGEVSADLGRIYRDQARREIRQHKILEHWEELQTWVQHQLPSAAEAERWLASQGAPVAPARIGVDPTLLTTALMNAKEVRSRYTVLRLAEDIGWDVTGILRS